MRLGSKQSLSECASECATQASYLYCTNTSSKMLHDNVNMRRSKEEEGRDTVSEILWGREPTGGKEKTS